MADWELVVRVGPYIGPEGWSRVELRAYKHDRVDGGLRRCVESRDLAVFYTKRPVEGLAEDLVRAVAGMV